MNKSLPTYLADNAANDRQQKALEDVAVWASYYRSNPHRYAEERLHLRLRLFQKILLMMMNLSNTFVFIATRGIGKSFLSAIFCVIRCILYPGQMKGSLLRRRRLNNPLNCWEPMRAQYATV